MKITVTPEKERVVIVFFNDDEFLTRVDLPLGQAIRLGHIFLQANSEVFEGDRMVQRKIEQFEVI